MEPAEVEITDARFVGSAPVLEREGFTLAQHAVGHADWFDEGWIDRVYAPSCEALVKALTGANDVVQFHRPLKRIADPATRGGHMVTAGFVHIDHPAATGEAIARRYAEAQGKSFKRAVIYNVWKAITPPPQDHPLAVSDRRTVPVDAHVVGVTLNEDSETPYVILAPNADTKFYFYSNMTVDESLVFTGVDMDRSHPLGCAHSAFVHPDGGVSRSSIEARIIAIFE